MWIRCDGKEFKTDDEALNDAFDFIDEKNLITEMKYEISYTDLVDKIFTAKNLEGLREEILDQFADARARLFPDLYSYYEEAKDE